MNNFFNNSGKFEDATSVETYKESKRRSMEDMLNDAIVVLGGLLSDGAKLVILENIHDGKPSIYIRDEFTNLAIRLDAKKGQVIYPGLGPYTEMQRQVAEAKDEIKTLKSEIKMLKFMQDDSIEVL